MYMNSRFVPNSTTATRRLEAMLTARWLHVSQWFKPVEKRDWNGVVTIVPEAQFVDINGKPRGRTYRKAVSA